MEVQVPAPGLVDDHHRLLRHAVDGFGDRLRVRGKPLIGRAGVEDRERLGVAAHTLEHRLGARRQQRLEARLVRGRQEAEVERERLQRVDDGVVDVASDEDQRVRALERERAEHDEVRPARAVHREHRAVGALGVGGEALRLTEDPGVVDEGAEEAGRDRHVGRVEVVHALLLLEDRGRTPAVVAADVAVEDADDR